MDKLEKSPKMEITVFNTQTIQSFSPQINLQLPTHFHSRNICVN